jgi:hypothetical protein
MRENMCVCECICFVSVNEREYVCVCESVCISAYYTGMRTCGQTSSTHVKSQALALRKSPLTQCSHGEDTGVSLSLSGSDLLPGWLKDSMWKE